MKWQPKPRAAKTPAVRTTPKEANHWVQTKDGFVIQADLERASA